jgi:hypothetical protein
MEDGYDDLAEGYDEYDFCRDLDGPDDVLECGCEREVINGKVVWITCDEHDEQSNYVPERPPLKKFRKSQDNN